MLPDTLIALAQRRRLVRQRACPPASGRNF
jgi:hypothetical protein